MPGVQEDGSQIGGFEPLAIAIQEHVARLEAEMDGTYPVLNWDNIEAFRAGEISLARINLAGDRKLVAQALGILLTRAADQNDELYCHHAFLGHPGSYLETLKAFFVPGKSSKWESQEIVRTDDRGYVWRGQRFVFTGDPRTKDAFIPAPMGPYFDRQRKQPMSRRELTQMLASPESNVFAGIIAAIYMGIQPMDLIPIYSQDRIPSGILADQSVKGRLRASAGKLDAQTIAKIKEAVYLLPSILLTEGEDNYYPSFAPNSFVEAVNLIMERGLVDKVDQGGLNGIGLGFTRYSHTVVPTLVLRGASEVAQMTTSAQKLYGDARTTKILSLFGSSCTTNIVTAYFNFETGAKVEDVQ